MQAGVGAEVDELQLREAKHERPGSDALLVPARSRGCEQATATTHDPRGLDQQQSEPAALVVATVKADVRRPDTGRVQRHAYDHVPPASATIVFGSRGANGTLWRRRRGRRERAGVARGKAIADVGNPQQVSGVPKDSRAPDGPAAKAISPRAMDARRRGLPCAGGDKDPNAVSDHSRSYRPQVGELDARAQVSAAFRFECSAIGQHGPGVARDRLCRCPACGDGAQARSRAVALAVRVALRGVGADHQV